MTTEELAKKFLEEEKFTLRNALAYGGMGLSKMCGEANEIATDIVFNGHSYNDERKDRMVDILGELMFYWQVLASTTGVAPKDISARFINYYLVKNNKATAEIQASLIDLMKHVKTHVKTKNKEEVIEKLSYQTID